MNTRYKRILKLIKSPHNRDKGRQIRFCAWLPLFLLCGAFIYLRLPKQPVFILSISDTNVIKIMYLVNTSVSKFNSIYDYVIDIVF